MQHRWNLMSRNSLGLTTCLAVGAFLSALSFPARPISGGVADVVGDFESVVLMLMRLGTGKISECTVSVIDDYTILTAAHCFYDPEGKKPITEAILFTRLGGVGRVPLLKGYVHPAYISGLAKGLPTPLLADVDIAIARSVVPISKTLHLNSFASTPVTYNARYVQDSSGAAILESTSLTSRFNLREVVKDVNTALQFQSSQKPDVYMVGFGLTSCLGSNECTDLASFRQYIGKRVGITRLTTDGDAVIGVACEETADVDKLLQAPQICITGTVESTTTPTNRKGTNIGEKFPVGTSFRTSQGDSGGVAALILQHGSASKGGSRWVNIGNTSWGTDEGVASSTGIVYNADFLFSVLNTPNTSKPTHTFKTKINAREEGLPTDGYYSLVTLQGKAVNLPGAGMSLSDQWLILQLGCDKRWHVVSNKKSEFKIQQNPNYRYQVCARQEDEGDRVLRGLYQKLISGGSLLIDRETLLLKDAAGKEQATFQKE